jgi:hypothetical protein
MKRLGKMKLESIQNKEFQQMDRGSLSRLRGGAYTLDTVTVTPSGNSCDGQDCWATD